ncbi:hypothetical protein IAR55_003459 [Kwoniella newhampshirensis]|uniref:MYND-type domain-containing protein n=1 Tax=Kwoniella newhampshirensis TaxID=1651941 RepID=A0AAW0YZH3_9TREE
MRESNYTFPPQNRAVTNITHMIYDRRALDTNSPLALLNSLTSLTYLTSTSPRIREILTIDGGLERLLDILRESCLPKENPIPQDLWGLSGPPTARVITMERANSLKHSLAFQCVVNIGVRGSEEIRTRVVQSGALDLVAQILESWLKDHGVSIFAGHLGSQGAVDAYAAGLPVPGTENLKRREREKGERSGHRHHHSRSHQQPYQDEASTHTQSSSSTGLASQAAAAFGFNLPSPWGSNPPADPSPVPEPQEPQVDTDVDMADAEGGETDDASIDADDASIDVDDTEREDDTSDIGPGQPSTTPRASTSFLPMTIPIPPRPIPRETQSQASSVVDSSLSGDDPSNTMPRNISESDINAVAQGLRPPALNLGSSRIPQLAQDPLSTQSSPMGTPTRNENSEGLRHGRRGTIVGRPMNLAPRNDRRRENTAGSGTSDGGEDIDLPTATIAAGIAAANAQAMEGGGTVVPDEPGPPPNVEIIETTAGQELDEPDPEAIAAEQARLDMEAGAPPGQPGAAQTPRVAPAEAATPRQAPGQDVPPTAPDQAQIIIANGAPRGFQDLGSYVGISSLLNPDGNRYSDDSILLALQLLAYLSKYPHVRTAFHHPRRPMHHTFDLGLDYVTNPLPERPAYSETPDIFSLVERFTFRPSPSDPLIFKVPSEIQYWAGVIMRNACRKDEARGGIRQCANMSCGKWEQFPREFAKCRRCRKAKYCSKECQSRAWQDGHRFWCSSRSDQEPGQAAAEPSVGSLQSRAPVGGTGEDEEDYQIGLQMGLSPEVVSRALAAARAAGIIPGGRGQPGGETPPPRIRGGPTPVRQPRNPVHLTPTRTNLTPTHAHAHLIDNDVSRQLALESQGFRPQPPSPDFAPAHHAPHRPRAPSPRGTETWRRFQNVGALLGLRPGEAATHQPPSPASRDWPMEPRVDREMRPQPPPPPRTESEGNRRGSQTGVRGLGFNIADERLDRQTGGGPRA